jgi:hypothetical protein
MQSDEGRGLYRAILASLQGFFSPDSRELEWDVLPRTIAWKLTQFQRERDEAVGRLSAARADGEAAGRASEREACARTAEKICRSEPRGVDDGWDADGAKRRRTERIAAAIRARKQDDIRNLKQLHDDTFAALAQAEARVAALEGAIRWALGEEGEFPAVPDGRHSLYWWRKELRARAALAPGQPEGTSEPSDFDALLEHHKATEAENARLKVQLAPLVGPTGAVEQWRNEAETNRQGYLKAVARAEQAEARVAKLEAALRAVEWVTRYGHDAYCPWCGGEKAFPGGHTIDCPRRAALSAPGQPEGGE